MNLSAEEFVERLLSQEAANTPCDSVRPEEVSLQLPTWFNEEKYNKGRRFFWEYRFAMVPSSLMGLAMVIAVPSIFHVLMATNRSSSPCTAYKRYLATTMHMLFWIIYELKPGTKAWKSLQEVRIRHIRTNLAGKLKGFGFISQRHLGVSHFAFFGFSILNPNELGIKQLRSDDWENYNHFWRVIGHTVGIKDKFNICRETAQETKDVCQILLKRVFTPCMEIVPEYYEYVLRLALNGPLMAIPVFNFDVAMYICKCLANVPGYVCTETSRIDLQKRLREQIAKQNTEKHVKASGNDIAVEATSLIPDNIDGLLPQKKHMLCVRDYDTLESAPEYRELSYFTKWRLSCILFIFFIYKTNLGRIIMNCLFSVNLLILTYFPVEAFFKFGIKAAYVDPYSRIPPNNAKPKTNSQFYEEKKSKSCKSWF